MSTTDIEAATAMKVAGNKAFKEHDWPTAQEYYTKAIEKYDKDPSFYSNRAQVSSYPTSLKFCIYVEFLLRFSLYRFTLSLRLLDMLLPMPARQLSWIRNSLRSIYGVYMQCCISLTSRIGILATSNR